ncbi:Lrp/AsnC ligand binding domain-containing protein [Fulvivirgaceae bacterium BMA10]|uniref:Lrp/AsnC ligand binding domain-containing protein n=1 Tax=Splendidivirga corallicola TaxID=3051826 RepID=A0ABT8KIE3_9BACT|nr:Lrp/AsnC ligand binding domain-containing protein [Fulvivirgaceae bacterium BMA10]
MKLNNQFDSLDKEILKKLNVDARIPFTQLAKDLGISNSLVHQRINKLKQSGVINRPTYMLDPKILGYETAAYTSIAVTNAKFIHDIITELEKIPEVVECFNITGKYALVIKIFAINNSHLREVLYEKVHPIRGVEGTDTIITFETAFHRSVPIEI